MTSRNYWEESLLEDDEAWVLRDNVWSDYWDMIEIDDYKTVLITYGHKGFLLIQDHRDGDRSECHPEAGIYLAFAYVSSKYRKQGVLKKLIELVKERFTGENIELYSRSDFTNKVWERIGFECTERRPNDCDEYILRVNNIVVETRIPDEIIIFSTLFIFNIALHFLF